MRRVFFPSWKLVNFHCFYSVWKTGRKGDVHVEEKSKITRRLKLGGGKERESSVPLLGSDHLAGRQIPARLTFSSKNEEKKKKKKKDKDISPGQGLVFRIRHYHSVFLSFSYNPRPVFVLHVFSLLSLSLSLLSTWILGSRSFPPGGQTE